MHWGDHKQPPKHTYSIRYGHASAPDASAAAANATASLGLAISTRTVRWITGDRDVKDREPLHALVATKACDTEALVGTVPRADVALLGRGVERQWHLAMMRVAKGNR